MKNFEKLSIVVPCYNEEETIMLFFEEVEKYKKKIGLKLEYIFVNDGSKDNTLNVLKKLYSENKDSVKYISFSRNFGKESAMLAGLKESTGDLITIMDVDLQDPPEIIPEMVKKMKEENISVRELARKAEVSPTIIQKLRNNKTADKINYQTFLSVVNSLGYRVNIERI